MNFAKRNSSRKLPGRNVRGAVGPPASLPWLGLAVLLCAFPALAQSQQSAPQAAASGNPQQSDQQSSGMISGTIVDQTGAAVAGARIKLAREDPFPSQEAVSDDDGRFSFVNIAPGPFYFTITSAGFAAQTYSGTLRPGDFHVVPPITLAVATAVTEVTVEPTAELAEKQIKEQEKQRVLGVVPNFYVSYIPDAAPLTPKQKYELAWKTTIDPVTFVIVGATAGFEQGLNQFSGYGQGAQGYGKRYGAAYADAVTGTFLGGAVLPSLMKQDPRYFYKGTGSTRSRILYAIANSVICKGDNGRWQFNYSGILGGLASGGISNAYYPPKDRGAGLVFENEGIGIGGAAVSNLIQEFLIPKLTPNLPNRGQPRP